LKILSCRQPRQRRQSRKDRGIQMKADIQFYTGKQKVMDTAGRVGRFKERYGRK